MSKVATKNVAQVTALYGPQAAILFQTHDSTSSALLDCNWQCKDLKALSK